MKEVTKIRQKPTEYNKARYGELIRNRRTELDLSQVELAKMLHVPPTYVGHWEFGRSRPDLNLVPALCRALDISLSYFFEEPESEDALTDQEKHFLRGYRNIDERDRAILDSTLESMITLKENDLWEYCQNSFVSVNHNDHSAAAGTGTMLDEDPESYPVYIRENPLVRKADEIVTVSGSSMEPMFHDGDDVYVEYTPSLEFGEIGLFIVNNDGFIKQFRNGYLHSLNPEYDDIYLHENDVTRCVGRVLGIVSSEDYPTEEELRILQEIERERRP